VSLDAEGVLDGGMHGEEPLSWTGPVEADPASFAPSKGLVRVLSAIVRAAAGNVPIGHAELAKCRTVGPQLVGHNGLGREPLLAKQAAHQLQGSPLVTSRLHQDIEDLALGINGAPQVHHPATDGDEDLGDPVARVAFETVVG